MENLTRKWSNVLTIAVAVVAASPIALGAGFEAPSLAPEARITVGFHEMPDGMYVGGEYQGERIVHLDEVLKFVTVVTRDADAFRARTTLDSDVRYVEETPWIRMIDFTADPEFEKSVVERPAPEGEGGLDYTPNDPRYSSQYGPAQVQLNLAWDTSTGDTDAAVCVGDTGVRYTHEDLTGTRWLGGRDVINSDNDPMDDNGHGTHVSGTAAATINNGLGVAGMGNVGLYGVKVLNSAGSGTWDQVATGIRWCADNTMARTVISLSLGASSGNTALADAVAYAYNTKGKLVVAAAGNDGPCSNCVNYPAKYAQAMAVTCTNNGEALCSFSSTGPEAAVAAPGDSIISTYYTSNTAYSTLSGTSMSTPHVSGIAALYWSYNTALTNAQLRTRIQDTAEDLGAAGRDNNFGYGEIDAKCLFDNTSPCGGGGGGGCTGGPSNNCFATPIAASGSSYQNTQSTSGATTESGEPAPCGNIGATVWYTYAPAASGTITVETTGSNYDTVVASYTGSTLGTLTNVACNDDISSTNTASKITFSGTSGTTYRIQAGGYNAATGSLTLKITGPSGTPSCSGGPSNNCFSSPIAASGSSYQNTQSTSGATTESGEPAPCGSIGATVWYTYAPSLSGTITIETTGSNFDTVVAAYTGSTLSGLTNVACNDDISSTNTASKITFSGTAGTTYRIQAGGYQSATGSLTLKITGPASCTGPSNNCFSTAIAMTTKPYTNTQSTSGATLETSEPRPCGSIGATVWYTYTPSVTGTITLTTSGSSYDTVLAAYTGSSLTSLTNVACNDDTGGTLQSQISFTATAGVTYRIQAGGYNSATGTLKINLS